MTPSPICLDANIIVKRLIADDDVVLHRQWTAWHEAGQQFVAPVLQRYELTNAFHRYQATGQFSIAFVESALASAFLLPIVFHDPAADHQRAMEIARQFNRPAAYDAHYLALAERLGVEFWTADRRLANAVSHSLSWVHLVGDDSGRSTQPTN
jgi:predicted nucleic acid-binding protein